MFRDSEIFLFGAGPMAQSYAKVLEAQGLKYKVFCRSPVSASRFHSKTGKSARIEPFEGLLGSASPPVSAIVAVSNDQLAPLAVRLLKAGVKRILLEKPGGITSSQVAAIVEEAKVNKAKVLIGFNRRFYASTIMAKKIIEADGGVVSCAFDFTEWLNFMPDNYTPEVYKTWILSNPIHVLDHFIHLCGNPVESQSFRSGSLDWHPSGTVFTGAGVTDQKVLFSYHADWTSAGRWNVEIYTANRKLIFSPMEKLSEVIKNTIIVKSVDICDQLDLEFKPGIYKQVEAFMLADDEMFCTIEQQLKNFAWYNDIAGYYNHALPFF